jgi:HAD superfamily 5'-nucleotidase-like hydrolase
MRSDSQKYPRRVDPRSPADVYVNRPLDLRRISAVGLDLDHTLAVYDDQAVNELAFADTCRYLIEARGYPAAIARLRYRNADVSRGIVVDVETGNLLKLDANDRVLRAFRDHRFLDAGELDDRYGDRSVVVNGGWLAEIHSPFDLPAGQLFAAVLGPLTRAAGREPDYSAVLDDVRRMLDRSHTRGDLKRRILRDPGGFVERRPGLASMIERLRAAGKRTFLLTNSALEHTEGVLEYVLGSDSSGDGWRSLFDLVIVDADKPRFFDVAGGGGGMATGAATATAVWGGGCAQALEQRLGVSGGAVLYIGDNPAADVVAARGSGWRTGMVVPELQFEHTTDRDLPNGKPRRGLGPWGSIFYDRGRPTRFRRVIEEHADVYAPCVEAILSAPPDHVFLPG